MIDALKQWTERLLGRGDAAITVPVLDGALRSNRLIEDAEVVAELEAPEDLAGDDRSLLVADGARVLRVDSAGAPAVEHTFDRAVSALTSLPGGGLAVALGGSEVRVVGGLHDGRRFDSAGGKRLNAVNALAAAGNGRLLASDGSQTQPPERWKHDVMELGRSGRLLEFNLADGSARERAAGLGYAFGVAAVGDDIAWVCESWRHRVLQIGGAPSSGRATQMAGGSYGRGTQMAGASSGCAVVDALPGYPSRIAPAQGGGWWLTCFILRTQLVEFVLREPVFRKRMLKEIDPLYWIAPALTSGNTFLEPMQGAHLKMMGVVKPWAPPRSYGLVIRLDEQGLIRYSLHSRFDGKHHGIVAALERDGWLYLLSKGRRRLLRLSIAAAEQSLAST
ncbi:MAG TPA: strictosidine synthase [Burkholderiaceae bacterium]|nr:strictosidine synthase [Burkholderiaceae bacterium]